MKITKKISFPSVVKNPSAGMCGLCDLCVLIGGMGCE